MSEACKDPYQVVTENVSTLSITALYNCIMIVLSNPNFFNFLRKKSLWWHFLIIKLIFVSHLRSLEMKVPKNFKKIHYLHSLPMNLNWY